MQTEVSSFTYFWQEYSGLELNSLHPGESQNITNS